MSAQHTPGEWIFDPKNIGGSYMRHIGIYAELPDGQIKTVANAPWTTDYDGDAGQIECAANARLIAAAPELLAACRAALDWINRFGADAPIVFGGEAQLAYALNAAIAKATGETAWTNESSAEAVQA